MARYLLMLIFSTTVSVSLSARVWPSHLEIRKIFDKRMQEQIDNCAASNGVVKGVWEEMRKRRLVLDAPNLKCAIACFLEHFKLIQHYRKADLISWKRVKYHTNVKYGNSPLSKIGDKLVKACEPLVKSGEKGRCELAADLANCYFKEGGKLGFFKDIENQIKKCA